MPELLEGVTIQVGGVDKVLPPLNWGRFKKFSKYLLSGEIMSDPHQMGEIVFAALQRNYPDMTLEQFEDGITPGEIMRVFPGLMEISGLAQAQAKSGE